MRVNIIARGLLMAALALMGGIGVGALMPSTASAQAPGFTVEPHPTGLRASGVAPAGERTKQIELRYQINGIHQTPITVAWNALRGTAIFEIDPETLPDGSVLLLWISQLTENRVWIGTVRPTPQTLTYTRPGSLDVRGVQDDVMWPGADYIRIIADQGGVPANIVWVMVGFGLAFIALVGVGGATQSPVVGGIAGGVVLGLITTPTIGIASLGLLLIYGMCVIGVSVVWN